MANAPLRQCVRVAYYDPLDLSQPPEFIGPDGDTSNHESMAAIIEICDYENGLLHARDGEYRVAGIFPWDGPAMDADGRPIQDERF